MYHAPIRAWWCTVGGYCARGFAPSSAPLSLNLNVTIAPDLHPDTVQSHSASSDSSRPDEIESCGRCVITHIYRFTLVSACIRERPAALHASRHVICNALHAGFNTHGKRLSPLSGLSRRITLQPLLRERTAPPQRERTAFLETRKAEKLMEVRLR